MEIAPSEGFGPRGLFEKASSGGVQTKQDLQFMLYDFYHQCLKRKVSRVTEWHTTPREYTERYLEFIREGYSP